MRKKEIWCNIVLPTLITVVWAILQLLPETQEKSPKWLKFMNEHNILIGFIITVIILLIMVIVNFVHMQQKKWLNAYLKDLIKSIFNGDFGKVRITVFKKKKRKLKIYGREGQPKDTTTKFKVVKDLRYAHGIASYCECCKTKKIVDTEYIYDFYDKNKPINKSNYNTSQYPKLNRYLQATFMTEETLKLIHRPSNHLYASPICDKDENTWGVFVVDICDKNDNVFTDVVVKKLDDAVRVISLTLNIIK